MISEKTRLMTFISYSALACMLSVTSSSQLLAQSLARPWLELKEIAASFTDESLTNLRRNQAIVSAAREYSRGKDRSTIEALFVQGHATDLEVEKELATLVKRLAAQVALQIASRDLDATALNNWRDTSYDCFSGLTTVSVAIDSYHDVWARDLLLDAASAKHENDHKNINSREIRNCSAILLKGYTLTNEQASGLITHLQHLMKYHNDEHEVISGIAQLKSLIASNAYAMHLEEEERSRFFSFQRRLSRARLRVATGKASVRGEVIPVAKAIALGFTPADQKYLLHVLSDPYAGNDAHAAVVMLADRITDVEVLRELASTDAPNAHWAQQAIEERERLKDNPSYILR